ncbi:ABC transporter permease [Paenibacillus harenae]|uniref:Multiple sugar transport system permease protein/putative aldouronate transport system permease protein n=1 Tax=Paenibacillus harenae TaxID=306543 RepID=A0ABT9U3E1_PAEHA|nr:ABC transporter permease subunit [Paenibacillus harenae]MDQ0113215.1 multiple sugar transport system permease protein/putative aldouronate transport system permease protein [Paenibacillus harenae]
METVNLSSEAKVTEKASIKGGRVLKQVLQRWQLYVFVAPAVLYLLVFQYFPMYGAQIAFKKYVVTKGIWGSPWVGLDQFIRFFNSYDFWRIMGNTLGLSIYELVAGFPLPIILALSLNYVSRQFFKKSVQMITYAPHFISTVVMVGMILQFLDPRTGIVNMLLGAIGLEPINFMGKAELFKSIYVWSGIWQNMGFACIIYLAALSGIDPALHEAAVVDGASKLRRMWHIDLPGILPIAIILLILNIGQILNIGFEKVFLMQNPLNIRSSEIIDTYVYKIGLVSQASNFSYATAIGLFKSVVSLLMLLSVNKLAKKAGQASLW